MTAAGGILESDASCRLNWPVVDTRNPSATPQWATRRRRNWSPWRSVGVSTAASVKRSASYSDDSLEMTAAVLPLPALPVMRVGFGIAGFPIEQLEESIIDYGCAWLKAREGVYGPGTG